MKCKFISFCKSTLNSYREQKLQLVGYRLVISSYFMIVLLFSFLSNMMPGEAEITISLDKSSLPVVDYETIKDIYIGPQYNPVTISHFSYKYFKEFIENNNQTAKEIFLNHANWLVNNTVNKDDYAFFVYNFPFPPYNLQPPWYSAMAQVKPMLPLLNAYKLTQDQTYLTTAKKLLNVLYIDINDPCKCGVTYKTLGNGWWYELYANGHENGPKVLNGMMFTLVDVYNYYNFTHDRDALYLFNQGILSLKNNLHNYDKNGNYSSYDKNRGTAPEFYHKVHLCLMDKLFDITKEHVFKHYSVNWSKSFQESPDSEKINEHCFATPVNKPLY